MSIISQYRCAISGWAVLLGVFGMLYTTGVSATTVDPQLAERIYKAIERTQTEDPDSYMATFDYQGPNGDTLKRLEDGQAKASDTESAQTCTGLPTGGKVFGSTTLDGELLDYEIDFQDMLVKANYQGQQHVMAAKDLLGFQSKEGWPCAVPIAAVVCGVAGGAFCGWRITQCYRAAERCPCGVAVYNCGVCGEGDGVVCRECVPRERDVPTLRPIFGGGWGWGF